MITALEPHIWLRSHGDDGGRHPLPLYSPLLGNPVPGRDTKILLGDSRLIVEQDGIPREELPK